MVINDNFFFNFPQWVDSAHLRNGAGWVDVKPLFGKGYKMYRKAYEAAAGAQSEQHQRLMRRTGALSEPQK